MSELDRRAIGLLEARQVYQRARAGLSRVRAGHGTLNERKAARGRLQVAEQALASTEDALVQKARQAGGELRLPLGLGNEIVIRTEAPC